jgi:hypothetical protein
MATHTAAPVAQTFIKQIPPALSNPRAAIFSPDFKLVQSWRRHLESVGIDKDVCVDAGAFLPGLQRNRYQAVILDCASFGEPFGFIATMRKLPSSKAAVVFAIVDDSRRCSAAFSAGANFVISRNSSSELIQRCLRVAQGTMLKDLAVYKRHDVSIRSTVWVSGNQRRAEITNISKGGCGLTFTAADLINEGPVEVQFGLPGIDTPLRLSGTIVWANTKQMAGMKFGSSNTQAHRALAKWLENGRA